MPFPQRGPLRGPEKRHFVYLVADRGGHVKIGYSTAPRKHRLKQIQTGNPRRCELLRVDEFPTEPEARRVEKAAQSRVARFATDGGTEWYACPSSTADKAITDAAEAERAPVLSRRRWRARYVFTAGWWQHGVVRAGRGVRNGFAALGCVAVLWWGADLVVGWPWGIFPDRTPVAVEDDPGSVAG